VKLLLLSSTGGFVVLTIATSVGLINPLDEWSAEAFRPNGQWGELQTSVDVIVESLQPRNVLLAILLLASAATVWKRSWRPLLGTGMTITAALALTLATKLALARPDVSGEIGGIGGSYPSGHVVSTLLAAGCGLLVLRERPRWFEWAMTGSVGAVMGWALLVQTAHWLTDVAGGVMLGVGALAAGSLFPWKEPAGHASRR
jgi:undecaprenyl-diphosphatase